MNMSMQTRDDPKESVKDEEMEVHQSGDDATKSKHENEPKPEEYSEAENNPQFLLFLHILITAEI